MDPLRLASKRGAPISALTANCRFALTLTNLSLGAVPIVYQADNIVVAAADDESNGFGIIIDPAPAGWRQRTRRSRSAPAMHESDVRFLGPRQSLLAIRSSPTAAAAMISDGGTAQAWYRMTVAGEHQEQREGARLIYPDQGLDILSQDVVFSDAIEIAPSA